VKQRSDPTRHVRYEKVCANCRDPYITLRKRSRYCSDACKQAAYRKRQAQSSGTR